MPEVHYETQDGIAVITVENPPVNALGQAVRAGLAEAFDRFAADGAAQVAVLMGAGRLFLGGADITEFGKAPLAPSLPDVIAGIEASPKPVLAAIHGAALGGGLEVALGCHWRIAAPGTRLGLPEVSLGILPGAGGTQRTPRLIGLEAAGRMIASGKPIRAEEAVESGLIDRLAGGDLRAAALAFAAELKGEAPRRTRDLPAPQGDLSDLRAATAAKTPGQIAPVTALDAVMASTRLPFDDGIAEERRLFRHLLDTPQRAGLIHAFFTDRAVAKVPGLDAAPRAIDHVGVVGGGTMGAGIATACLLAGLRVTLVERNAEGLDRARATIDGNLDTAVQRGKLTADKRAGLAPAFATEMDALAEADIAIEAVFEAMDVKREVFATLDRVCKPGAVLATNTSYLDVNEIAVATDRPADVVGLHFFSPAHVMKLLEVVVTDATAPDVTATGFALAKRLGKIAVRAGVCDGFIGNRILSAYRAAADRMVLDGASPYAIDAAIRDFGFPMGPYQVSDLAGLDIGFMTRERLKAEGAPQGRRATFADALYHAGRLGRKTGKGYYNYTADKRGAEDPEVERIVAESRTGPARALDADEITRRYMAAMVNEAARVVAEGIAARPLDVDAVLLHGYGFPRWKGGPMHWADAQGLDTILADIERFAAEEPDFWQPAPLLRDLAREGGAFADLNRKDTA
ncbi:3-hydroxyacyl-CoA dehydrogenase NAD-binding domain-containing protein [Jannaschia ovalis]|uniref:3-hydroxyacyl-CoA dehydrogenase NAD-binding domain-containing protein n=1 Tax=Jannaschia ovalis TaxID=3038773 RepID=A0ABY8L7L7_9RHOB|nr:3-hydroxyacyl-CoA dehydrogenase NAD-binding domain-containing protein [Jannaschia sp. GRR-S6-38]WGH77286.1 3-hydroxyacyl-CoA dehydrogenase NAD-binding domain-containing protein [Jannaschia sp. GRR-S6-38]